jgi:FKBP-type peptidyl-prolyl cis-trans isomerase
MAIVVVGMSMGCDSGKFKASEDGYQYKYVVKGDGELPQQGEVVVYNMMYKDEKDSIIFQTTAGQPAMMPYDSGQWSNMGALYKAFAMIREGDSILIKIPTKTFFDESIRQPVPPYLNAEGELTFYVGAPEYLTREEADIKVAAIRKERMKSTLEERQAFIESFIAENQEKINSDLEVIDQYLEENNIAAQSTETGLRYVIDVEGTGDYPQPGDNVAVHYSGTLLDGTKFDSSYDRGDPFRFQLGLGSVILGWDLGIQLLKKGGKGTLYIPSSLAYGPQARGDVIRENSILKFDVELVDIQE